MVFRYLLDPHTAVAWRASKNAQVILSTAHPAKFPEVVIPLVGARLPIPVSLAACQTRRQHFLELDEPNARALQELLQSLWLF